MRKTIVGLTVALPAAIVAGIGLWPAAAQDTTFSDAQKKAVEQIVRDYLRKNPEILIEMSAELEKRQSVAEAAARSKAIAENASLLFRSPGSYVAGNPKGDVTIVEFFDYNCQFCKRALDDLLKVLDTDKNVRVVFKELPIFGEASEDAAKVALASIKQGKYFELHNALLRKRGQATKASALRVAGDLGLDVDKLKADMNAPDVLAEIDETKALAERIGLQGTPLYLVGDQIIPGAPHNLYDLLVEKVTEVRKNGCQVAC
ncbi:MAG: DsbA family protein [Hyphomicrobiales bacterium]|nr:DsbA family protein [Hyphomicrobiales bacterium]